MTLKLTQDGSTFMTIPVTSIDSVSFTMSDGPFSIYTVMVNNNPQLGVGLVVWNLPFAMHSIQFHNAPCTFASIVMDTSQPYTYIESLNVVEYDSITKFDTKYIDYGTNESIGVNISDWTDSQTYSPFTAIAEMPCEYNLTNNSVIELVNNEPVQFAKYGFAILSADVSNNTITFGCINKPNENITLKINVRG